MSPVIWLIAVVALGIDVGWQPLSEGGSEFVIQIEPEMLGSLEQGQEIVSALPAEVRDLRSLRVRVGSGRLPRELAPTPAVETAENPTTSGDSPTPTSLHVDREEAARATYAEPATDDDTPNVEVDQPPAKREEPAAQPEEAMPPDEDAQLAATVPAIKGAPQSGKIDQVVGYGSEADVAATVDKSALAELSRTVHEASQSRSWLIPTAIAILFLSIGANVFLTWVTWGARGRYLDLLRRVKGSGISSPNQAGA